MTDATLIQSRKMVFADGTIIEIWIWLVPSPVSPSLHQYKYSLYYGRPGQRLVGYDNERGKGDHKHVRSVEYPHPFVSIDQAIDDFLADVAAIRDGRL